jgi:plastocyanin
MRAKKRDAASVIRGLLLLGVAAVSVGCSEHQDPVAADDGGGEVVEVEIRNFEFSPSELHIAAGTTVRWRNTVDNYHTVTPDGHATWQQWQTTKTGETFEFTFETPGSYPYYCAAHRSLMTGTVIVE